MTGTFDLTKEAILGRLYVGQAGVYRRSKTLTLEAAEKHEADPDSVRGIVHILTAQDRAEIVKVQNQARLVFYTNTLPWDDNAYRLVPLTRYNALTAQLRQLQNGFFDAVSNLVNRYPELLANYHKRVNDLAQEIPFPTREQLMESFKFELFEMPLANPNDVRLKHVDSAVVEDIKERVNRQMEERLQEAQAEIVARLYDLVSRVKTQTSKNDGRIFKSLIENIEEAVEVLPQLNVSGDEEIARLIDRVRTELASIDVEGLRKDEKLRKQTSKSANSILDDLKNFSFA